MKGKKVLLLCTSICFSLVIAAAFGAGHAKEATKVVRWATHPSGTGMHAAWSGWADVVSRKTGIKIRIVPIRSDVEKVVSLTTAMTDFCAMSSASFYTGYYGTGDFEKTGAKPLRIAYCHDIIATNSFVVRGDSGLKKIGDLKGKKVTYVTGAPGLNIQTEAFLAFAGLTWDDVVRVACSSMGDQTKAVMDGRADAAFSTPTMGVTRQAEAAPHGIAWLPMPHDNEAGWARLKKIAPFYVKNTETTGAGVSKERPLVGAGIMQGFGCMPEMDADLVYAMAKGFVVGWEDAKGIHVYISRSKPDNYPERAIKFAIPFHPGAIKYLKDANLWTKKLDEWQKKMLAAEKKRMK